VNLGLALGAKQGIFPPRLDGASQLSLSGIEPMNSELLRKLLIAGAAVAALSVAACNKPADKADTAATAATSSANTAAAAADTAQNAAATAADAAADANKADAAAKPADAATPPATPEKK
jgi:poly-gamma-glutamate capsule biosynthesis protein CapA/YwtB (metallophosphatase superfamily)